jgi:hypothetical protein
MNHFLIHPDPAVSAKILFDLDKRRAIKQILESAQMSAYGTLQYGYSQLVRDTGGEYKLNNQTGNHPCTLWVVDSRENYIWHVSYIWALLVEYTKRGGKQHACERAILRAGIPYVKPITGIMPPFVGSDKYYNIQWDVMSCSSTTDRYRAYLANKWIAQDGIPLDKAITMFESFDEI